MRGSAFILQNVGYGVIFFIPGEVNHLASLLDTGTGISRTASCFSVNKLRRSCNQKSERLLSKSFCSMTVALCCVLNSKVIVCLQIGVVVVNQSCLLNFVSKLKMFESIVVVVVD